MAVLQRESSVEDAVLLNAWVYEKQGSEKLSDWPEGHGCIVVGPGLSTPALAFFVLLLHYVSDLTFFYCFDILLLG